MILGIGCDDDLPMKKSRLQLVVNTTCVLAIVLCIRVNDIIRVYDMETETTFEFVVLLKDNFHLILRLKFGRKFPTFYSISSQCLIRILHLCTGSHESKARPG